MKAKQVACICAVLFAFFIQGFCNPIQREEQKMDVSTVYTKKETTGVEHVEVSVATDKDAHVYNLQGVRMNAENLPAGIYIKGGKNFVVK